MTVLVFDSTHLVVTRHSVSVRFEGFEPFLLWQGDCGVVGYTPSGVNPQHSSTPGEHHGCGTVRLSHHHGAREALGASAPQLGNSCTGKEGGCRHVYFDILVVVNVG